MVLLANVNFHVFCNFQILIGRRPSKKMILQLQLLMFISYSEIKALDVFSFPEYLDANLSYISLETSKRQLFPEKRIICLSHMESLIDGRSFLTILGENDEPWLSLSIWQNQGVPSLWMCQANIWHHLIDIKLYWLNFWIHTSLLIDAEHNQISLMLNREVYIVKQIKELRENIPVHLSETIFLGIGKLDGEDWKQFKESIANMKIYSTPYEKQLSTVETTKKLLLDTCVKQSPETSWKIVGQTQQRTENVETINNNAASYPLIIPAVSDLMEGYTLCKRFSGKMALAEDDKSFENILEMFKNVENPCNSIWTPITDWMTEGTFRHLETNSLISYLPWNTKLDEPRQSRQRNNVIIHNGNYTTLSLNVSDGFRKMCTFCDLPNHTLISLIGMCRKSYMGEFVFFEFF